MLPKDLMKYLEKRDDTIKDLKKSRNKETSMIDFSRYVELATNSMWAVNSWDRAVQLGNQPGASANQAAMGLAQYENQYRAISNQQRRYE